MMSNSPMEMFENIVQTPLQKIRMPRLTLKNSHTHCWIISQVTRRMVIQSISLMPMLSQNVGENVCENQPAAGT